METYVPSINSFPICSAQLLASCIHHKTRIGTVFHYSSVKALHQYVNGVSLESNISVLLCASVSIYHATKLITGSR